MLNELSSSDAVGTTTTEFLYDGVDLIAEYNASGAVLRRYVHGPGMDEPLVWYEGSGTSNPRYLHADERGSIVAVSNSSGGGLEAFKYSPDGESANAANSRFGYTGQVWLAQLGLYYYKSRMYSPDLGRFLQPDPIGYAGETNLYSYVAGDPINRVDPFGLDDEDTSVCRLYPDYCRRRDPAAGSITERDIDALDMLDEARIAAGVFNQVVNEAEPQGQQPDQNPTEPPCPDGPSYMDRYVDWTSDHVINVGPYVAALAGGLWPKSWSPATGGRPPLLGSTNPLTSVPRAFGIPGADTAIARTGAAGTGLLTVGIGFYNLGIELQGFLYAIPDYGAGSCKKPN